MFNVENVGPVNCFFNFQIAGFKPLDVALGTSDCVYYPLVLADKSLSKKSKELPQFGVVLDIKTSQRVPEVRIRSPLQVNIAHAPSPYDLFVLKPL